MKKKYQEDSSSEKRIMKVIRTKVGGHRAYRLIFKGDKEIVENILYNKEDQSYQLTLVSSLAGYRQELKHLRELLKSPYDVPTTLCSK